MCAKTRFCNHTSKICTYSMYILELIMAFDQIIIKMNAHHVKGWECAPNEMIKYSCGYRFGVKLKTKKLTLCCN